MGIDKCSATCSNVREMRFNTNFSVDAVQPTGNKRFYLHYWQIGDWDTRDAGCEAVSSKQWEIKSLVRWFYCQSSSFFWEYRFIPNSQEALAEILFAHLWLDCSSNRYWKTLKLLIGLVSHITPKSFRRPYSKSGSTSTQSSEKLKMALLPRNPQPPTIDESNVFVPAGRINHGVLIIRIGIGIIPFIGRKWAGTLFGV